VPYLNSSLFEENTAGKATLFISETQERNEIFCLLRKRIKDSKGKRVAGTTKIHCNIFWNSRLVRFSSEVKDLIQEQNKSIINAFRTRIDFWKENGYKDAHTLHLALLLCICVAETLRKAVVQKFKDSSVKVYQKV